MPALTTIQLRRGSSSQWTASTNPLSQGELGLDTTIKKFKIGDGTSLWSSLPWANIMGADFIGVSGINVSYSSPSGNVTVSVTGLNSSYLSDFNTAVSGLLPVKNILAGTNISVSGNNGIYTISSNGVDTNTVKDVIGATIIGVSGIRASYDNSSKVETISVTGLTASYIGDFNTAVRTNRLDQMAVPTGDVSFNSVKITSLADPVSTQDAATKAYVDAVTKAYVDAARMGLDVKQSARVATTANITLSGTQTIDGVAVVVGDRVLVKNQSVVSENGIYEVVAGSWSRASDADSNAKVTTGLFTFVSEGTVNADSGWVLTTNDAITLGTTSLVFAQFSGAGQITAGTGLTKNGNTIDAVGTAGRIVVNSDNIDLDTVFLSRPVNNIPFGATVAQSVVFDVTTDSYGRVTEIRDYQIFNASTDFKGLASFDSGDFSVSSGSVSIKTSGVDNSQLVNSSVTIGSTSVSLGGTISSIVGLTSISGVSIGSPTVLANCSIDGGTP